MARRSDSIRRIQASQKLLATIERARLLELESKIVELDELRGLLIGSVGSEPHDPALARSYASRAGRLQAEIVALYADVDQQRLVVLNAAVREKVAEALADRLAAEEKQTAERSQLERVIETSLGRQASRKFADQV